MKLLKPIICVAMAMVLASCSVVNKQSYSPDRTQLNLQMSDLEYLGETEISVVYDTYLGIFTRIDEINGVKYDGKVHEYANLHTNRPLSRKLVRATPKVLEEYPEASYFIVTKQTVEKELLFLGSEKKVTATVKAYKIK